MNEIKLEITSLEDYLLIEPSYDGKKIGFDNPIEPEMIETINLSRQLEEAGFSGRIVIISGMPAYLTAAIALQAKNLFSVVAMFDPKLTVEGEKKAVVIDSLDSDYRRGSQISVPFLIV